MSHKFYVVANMNRKAILGRDWLVENGVRLYFDLGCLRVHDVYVTLEEDIHINSVVKLQQDTIIKPQSVQICNGQLNGYSNLQKFKTIA